MLRALHPEMDRSPLQEGDHTDGPAAGPPARPPALHQQEEDGKAPELHPDTQLTTI